MTACQWCDATFGTNTDKAIHVHDAHPDTIGRGRTQSAAWHCHRCARPNQPQRFTCAWCDWARDI